MNTSLVQVELPPAEPPYALTQAQAMLQLAQSMLRIQQVTMPPLTRLLTIRVEPKARYVVMKYLQVIKQ